MQATSLSPHFLLWLLLVPLVAWRLVKRMQRLVGRQRFRPVRAWLSATVLPLLLLVVAVPALPRPGSLAAWGAGVACGIALGLAGLRRTRFEPQPDALYYTPNAHIGIALSVLLVMRVGWRMLQGAGFSGAASASAGGASPALDGFSGAPATPLTLAVLAVTLAYYATYGIGLLRRRRAIRHG